MTERGDLARQPRVSDDGSEREVEVILLLEGWHGRREPVVGHSDREPGVAQFHGDGCDDPCLVVFVGGPPAAAVHPYHDATGGCLRKPQVEALERIDAVGQIGDVPTRSSVDGMPPCGTPIEGGHGCMTCASQASPLLSALPYGVTAAAAVAIGRFTGKGNSEADAIASTGDDDS